MRDTLLAEIGFGCASAMLMAPSAAAAFTKFTTFEAWQRATTSYSTIGFTELPNFTVVTDQYADDGVNFSSDTACVALFGAAYQLDGVGIHTEGSFIDIAFSTPQRSFATFGPGLWKLDFYLGELLVGSTGYYLPSPPAMTFGGGMSDMPFDKVRIKDWPTWSTIDLDNIYFSTVPAPAGVLVLVLGVALRRRRRG